ncbi:MAG: cyclophilin-like fold protein [Coriobacteriaceae bacterium]|nr:cyclophilin-like fold protein [Coriobacteriaceae bacterium]
MKRMMIAVAIGLTLLLAGCANAGSTPSSPASSSGSQSAPQEPTAATSAQQSDVTSAAHEDNEGEAAEMRLSIDGTDVDVAWEDNQAVAELKALAADGPVTVELHMYGGFEQVGPLGTTLTASDEQVTTSPGDIMLYAGDQISIFYGTNSWAYTKLGHISDKTAEEMTALLGNGDVSITITTI